VKAIAAGHETVSGFLSRYQEFVSLQGSTSPSPSASSPAR